MARASLSRETSLGYQVNLLGRLLAQALRERIDRFGVVPGQFAQLLALYEQDGLTQADLCERVRIEQPTMASTLNRMERDGLIRRVPDPTDRRRSLVMLTARSRKLEDELIAAARSVNATATRGLSDREVAVFMKTMGHIIDNLDDAGARDAHLNSTEPEPAMRHPPHRRRPQSRDVGERRAR